MNNFFKTYDDTKMWLDKMFIKNYKINDNLIVDTYDCDVFLFNKQLEFIPVQFGIVSGNFLCDSNRLTILEGSPKEVKKSFSCRHNKLTSFKGLPELIGEDIFILGNNLTSMEGLSIYNLKKNVDKGWFYSIITPQMKQNYFNQHLKQNPELIEFIKNDPTIQPYYKRLLRKNKLKIFV